VIARGGRVVGRGFHRAYGGPHAEVEALKAAGRRAAGATVYVSLEPCAETGKTGPCTEALVAARVARVVYAVRDPAGGGGAAALARAGIDVTGPAPSAEARALLAPFRRAQALGRPWVVLKWAMSLDGRTAPAPGVRGEISGAEAWRFVHDLRGRVEAVAVGVGTVLSDDPRLTCRRPGGPPNGRRQPAAVVFDSGLRIPPTCRLVRESSPARPLYVLTASPSAARARSLSSRPGVEVLAAPARDGLVDLSRALRLLKERGVARLLLEGGPTIAGAFVRRGLVDQVAAIVAPLLLGGDGAPAALAGTGVAEVLEGPRLSDVRLSALGHDALIQGFLA
jgi:diaminohydroxyphosphoribosylaminopyrimidine deaminase / 5-amino-6-(5-phosphoribosylamino)uracil reductase